MLHLIMELPDGDTVYANGAEALATVFADEGWYAVERSRFFEAVPGGRRPLALADVTSDADDQFRYYSGTLRDAKTGHPVAPPMNWDVRWVR
jgi:hypothetical protein